MTCMVRQMQPMCRQQERCQHTPVKRMLVQPQPQPQPHRPACPCLLRTPQPPWKRPPVTADTEAGASPDAQGFQRRSSSALLTTETELSAMAAPASIGLSMPKAASGMPITL